MAEVPERENVCTVPNILCVSRILLSPYIGYLIVREEFSLACAVLVVAGATDLLDGWIARTFQSQSSSLGSFLDPLADKILIATSFVSLTYIGRLPTLLTSLVVFRDVALLLAGFYIKLKSLPSPRTIGSLCDLRHATAQLSPTLISKTNTAMQLITLASTLIAYSYQCSCYNFLFFLWCLTGVTTVVSGVSYVFVKGTFSYLKEDSVPQQTS